MSNGSSARLYYVTFGTLIVLTILTVAVSRIDLGGHNNVFVGVAIAAAKATVVALFFMHLKTDGKNRIFYVAALFPVALFVILVSASSADLAFLLGREKVSTPPPMPAEKSGGEHR